MPLPVSVYTGASPWTTLYPFYDANILFCNTPQDAYLSRKMKMMRIVKKEKVLWVKISIKESKECVNEYDPYSL